MKDETLTHLDLFSGYGGNSIAFEAEGFRTIAFSEIADYPSKILKDKWPNVPNFGAIQNISRSAVIERTGTLPLVITGGFPCQPHSTAGLRKASADDRDLWAECIRMLRELQPRYALYENVSGLTTSEQGLFLNRVFADLASINYSCIPPIIPASAVGAPHRRERIWLLCVNDVADSNRIGLEGIPARRSKTVRWGGELPRETPKPNNTFSHEPRLFGFGDYRGVRESDGTPNRAHRLKAIGNGIVPQVAQVFARAIKMNEIKHGRTI